MEPDKLMYSVAMEFIKLKNIHGVCGVNKGAYSYETEITFKNDFASGSSKVSVIYSALHIND